MSEGPRVKPGSAGVGSAQLLEVVLGRIRLLLTAVLRPAMALSLATITAAACGCMPLAAPPVSASAIEMAARPRPDVRTTAPQASSPSAFIEDEPQPLDVEPSSNVQPLAVEDNQLDRSERRVIGVQPHPLQGLSRQELQSRLQHEPATLGSMSVGRPNGGALFNAVQLPEDPRWERVDASHAWGTQETIDGIEAAVATVNQRFPDSLPLPIGHISDADGGPLSPHRSHQSGRDVDMGFYYKPDVHRWYLRGTQETLDLPRTWALVRALITETDVNLILVDHSIQRLLRDYAQSIGEDEAWLADIFDGSGYKRPALIRHAPGHATHLHVRFFNPVAQETARLCYPALVALNKVKPPVHYLQYRARKGDTLIGLAKRYGTTVRALKRANGLRSNLIMAKRTYKIPRTGPAAAEPVAVLPERRLPPAGLPLSGTSSGQARR